MSEPGAVTPSGRQKFAEFLSFLTEAAARWNNDEASILAEIKPRLKALVSQDDWLDEQFTLPDPNYYQHYLLYCDPLRRFSVVSFVWGPGQETPIHDHTVWGLIGMLRGAEISETYEIQNGKPVLQMEERLEPGAIAMVSPSIGDIHRVRNASADKSSISIHVYGGDIGAVGRHVFLPEGGVKKFVSGYSNQVLPNLWGAN